MSVSLVTFLIRPADNGSEGIRRISYFEVRWENLSGNWRGVKGKAAAAAAGETCSPDGRVIKSECFPFCSYPSLKLNMALLRFYFKVPETEDGDSDL
jgi:hypothetical protein